eukprot:GHVU01225019.1.p1 GENE.GHVU01225019.1~~GHVU01225019.1.p1  ORF type:complete len:171 (+),score=15.41 GHVU01225019.1:102-614(+)
MGNCCGSSRGDDAIPGRQKRSEFINDCVIAHNRYRRQHGKVGDLKQNKEQSVIAQRWADHLASTRVLKHSSDTYKGLSLGENIATKWSSAGADYGGQEVVDNWYSEVNKYTFGSDYMEGTGHFTQVVWKGSRTVGVGRTYSNDGRVFVVCNYFPAGNVIGHFPENVFRAS